MGALLGKSEEFRRHTVTNTEQARALVARRHRVDRACEVCGTLMPGVLRRQRHCSNACRCKAYRERKKAGENHA